MKLVGLSGNHARPSRTRVLVDAVANAVEDSTWSVEVFDLLDLGAQLGATFSYDSASSDHRRVWDSIKSCDALVVGSPVYKASYSGLLKHIFDLMEMDILVNKPVLLVATGKAPQHALMIDHQFRPLFAFFKALTLPTSLFATDADFDGPEALGDKLQTKVIAAAAEIKRFAAL